MKILEKLKTLILGNYSNPSYETECSHYQEKNEKSEPKQEKSNFTITYSDSTIKDKVYEIIKKDLEKFPIETWELTSNEPLTFLCNKNCDYCIRYYSFYMSSYKKRDISIYSRNSNIFYETVKYDCYSDDFYPELYDITFGEYYKKLKEKEAADKKDKLNNFLNDETRIKHE